MNYESLDRSKVNPFYFSDKRKDGDSQFTVIRQTSTLKDYIDTTAKISISG